MTSEIVSVLCGGRGLTLPSECTVRVWDNSANKHAPCEVYQTILESSIADVLVYVHDDVTIHDPLWQKKVMTLFDRPECVVVGLGGALTLGRRDLYRKPYNIWAMARGGYASNQTDAEVHGGRISNSRRVAVVDAFFMAVRVAWLRQIGGWPVGNLTHHCLDLWLACEAARTGREIWTVGCSVTHHGGGSSTGRSYPSAKWLQGGTMELDHQIPHKWLWDEYRDVLPVEVG